MPTLVAVIGSQGIGLILALLLVVLSGEARPPIGSLGWAALAGLAGLCGLAAFYRVLAAGEMSLAAPLVAVVGAGLPAIVGIVAGERLAAPQLAGLACGLVAVTIVSRSAGSGDAAPAARATARSLPLIFLAGLGFAGFYLAIGRSTALGDGAAWWPLLVARCATVGMAVLVMARLRPRLGPGFGGAWPIVAISGAGDLGGNAFFLLSNAHGAFSLAVLLSSLYPVTTVLLAGLLLQERLGRPQVLGVGLALLGVLLIAI